VTRQPNTFFRRGDILLKKTWGIDPITLVHVIHYIANDEKNITYQCDSVHYHYNLRASLCTGDSISTTTITSTGTISQINPDTILVKTTASDDPVSYSYTKTTSYVDENDNPISSDAVELGLPVTVYYDKEADWRLVATKVIVRKATSATTTTPSFP